MKTFAEWLKETHHCKLPKGEVNTYWLAKHGLPMIVHCTCCKMTMALPNAYIDDKGNIYCADCKGDD